MASQKVKFVYDLPYSKRHMICKLLDIDNSWKTLAIQMDCFTQLDIITMEQAVKHGPNYSSADMLFTELNQKAVTVVRLIKKCHHAGLNRVRDLLKENVSEQAFNDVTSTIPGQFLQQPVSNDTDTSMTTEELPNPSKAGLSLGGLQSLPPSFPSSLPPQHNELSQMQNRPGYLNSMPPHPAVENTLAYTQFQKMAAAPGAVPTKPCHDPLPPQENLTSSNTVAMKKAMKEEMSVLNIQQFPFEEIKRGTFGFHEDCVLGSGGFGTVYKTNLKRTFFAVKKLKPRNSQKDPERNWKMFLKEISALVRYPQENIIQLSGYSADGPEICLVYQYMPNGSLEDRLECKGGTMPLSWQQRLNILTGSACGIQYLHSVGEKPLIHGDIKSANILLDKHMDPKVADFGLAMEATGSSSSKEFTHVSRRDLNESVYGSRAYLPEEFFRNFTFNTKTDVYSFGIVIFETCIGEKAHDPKREGGQNLKDYVSNVYESSNKILRIRDRRASDWPDNLWLQDMDIGRKCTARAKKDRPEMHMVFTALKEQSNANLAPDASQSMNMSHYSQGQGHTLKGANENGLPGTFQGRPMKLDDVQGQMKSLEMDEQTALVSSLPTVALIEAADKKVGTRPGGNHSNPPAEFSTTCKEVPDCGPLLLNQYETGPSSLDDINSDNTTRLLECQPFSSFDDRKAPGLIEYREKQRAEVTDNRSEVTEQKSKMTEQGHTKKPETPSVEQTTDLLNCDADDPRWEVYDKSKLGEDNNQGLGLDQGQGQGQGQRNEPAHDKFTEPLPLKLQKAYDKRKESIESQGGVVQLDVSVVVSGDGSIVLTNPPQAGVKGQGQGEGQSSQEDHSIQKKGVVTEIFDNTCNAIKEGSLAKVGASQEEEISANANRHSQTLSENLEHFAEKDYPDFLDFGDTAELDTSYSPSGRITEELYGNAEHQPQYPANPDIVQSSSCHNEGGQWAVSGQHSHGDCSTCSPRPSSPVLKERHSYNSPQTRVSQPESTRTNATPPIYQQSPNPDNVVLNVNSCPDRREPASFPYSTGPECSADNPQGAVPVDGDRSQHVLELRQRAEGVMKPVK